MTLRNLEGFTSVDSIPRSVWDKALAKPMKRLQGFNIITDTFRHVPKTIHYCGVKLLPNKRGVLLIDWWPGGGMELQFRSMRTARVYARDCIR